MFLRNINLNIFHFLGIMSFEPRGCPHFNCDLCSLAILLSNFLIGISICAGIFIADICDFITFVESIKAPGNLYARSCK